MLGIIGKVRHHTRVLDITNLKLERLIQSRLLQNFKTRIRRNLDNFVSLKNTINQHELRFPVIANNFDYVGNPTWTEKAVSTVRYRWYTCKVLSI